MSHDTSFQRLLQKLIRPSESIELEEDRRQARLLSAFLIVLIFATLFMVLNPDAPLERRLSVGSIGLCFVGCYFLSRTGYYKLAGLVTVLLPLIPPFVNSASGLNATIALKWLAIAIVMGGLWLSTRGLILVVAIALSGTFIVPLVLPAVSYPDITQTFIFLSLISLLMLVAVNIRTRHQREIKAKSAALMEEIEERKKYQQELQRHKENLEAIVKEQTVELQQALQEVGELKDRLQAENIYLQEEIKLEHNFDEIISNSQKLKEIFEKVEQVAASELSVLIIGETGTGKELVARAIHNISDRSGRPMIKVNCAVLPANLIESELFGHEKGAFTGAHASKVGRFEVADGGTLFLDEIGEMPYELQSKLLRVLQEGEFERLGSSKTIKVDVRVLAATNRNLEAAIQQHQFRDDLFFRLNRFPIELPPLRERKEDIPLLVRHFIEKHAGGEKNDRYSLSKAAMKTLENYAWPGNIRELENIIERALVVSKGNKLEFGDWFTTRLTDEQDDMLITLDEAERRHISIVLDHTGWRISGEKGAARILGLPRTTLDSKIKKLGIKKT